MANLSNRFRTKPSRLGTPVVGRLRGLRWGLILVLAVLVGRLADLQILNHRVYEALASGQRDLYRELFPERGDILVRDADGTEAPLATNRYLSLIWADPRQVQDAVATADVLAEVLGLQREPVCDGECSEDAASEYDRVLTSLQKSDDPYEPIRRRVGEAEAEAITAAALAGVFVLPEEVRFYPERQFGAHVTGFVRTTDEGQRVGTYGIEGAWDEVLRGTPGFLFSERDARGRWISVGTRAHAPAQDGADVVLTVDRTIQYVACKALEQAVTDTRADSGSLVILQPKTGAVLAICGAPTFDPNDFGKAENVSVYNTQALFDAYEPGSIFKPIVMAGALDLGVVHPSMTYTDEGEVKIDRFTIRNFDKLPHGVRTMTQVLEESLNLGMIFVMRSMGLERMSDYVHAFGFGQSTGVQAGAEANGTIESVDKGHEIYSATASYGQGLTATVMQMAAAYGALANGGTLYKPYIVDTIRAADGTEQHTRPQVVRQVLSSKASQTITAMLVSVLDQPQSSQAAVDGYFLAGKTGTAQVSDAGGGYKVDETIASFVGYGPVDNPAFVVAIRINHPRTSPWAGSTAAPLFSDIASFLLSYLHIPPQR